MNRFSNNIGGKLKFRLITLVFLEYAVWGAYLISIGRYLAQAGLGSQIKWFFATNGIVTVIGYSGVMVGVQFGVIVMYRAVVSVKPVQGIIVIIEILAALKEHGISSIEEANKICDSYGIDPYKACEETQPICFENAKWAYVVGCAIALKEGEKTGDKSAVKAAENIGIGLQSFCIPGSVADDRKVGLGHGNLAARLLSEKTQCFAFLAGHESFAAAEGAIKIAAKADKVLTTAAYILCRRSTVWARMPHRLSAA